MPVVAVCSYKVLELSVWLMSHWLLLKGHRWDLFEAENLCPRSVCPDMIVNAWSKQATAVQCKPLAREVAIIISNAGCSWRPAGTLLLIRADRKLLCLSTVTSRSPQFLRLFEAQHCSGSLPLLAGVAHCQCRHSCPEKVKILNEAFLCC